MGMARVTAPLRARRIYHATTLIPTPPTNTMLLIL